MNKNTEKKAYVAPQMKILRMDTRCQLLQDSVFYQQKKSNAKSVIVNDSYDVVDFD